MALSVSIDQRKAEPIGNSHAVVSGTVDFDSSYPTGGEDANPISKYFETCFRIILENYGRYNFRYDKANDKIKVFENLIFIVDNDSPNGNAVSFDDSDSLGARLEASTQDNADRTEIVTNDEVGDQTDSETDLSGVTGVSFIAVGIK